MPNSALLKTPHVGLSRRSVLNAAATGAFVVALGAPMFALAARGEAPGGGPIYGDGHTYNDPLVLLDESLAQAFVGSDFDISSNTAYAKLRLSKVVAVDMPLKKSRLATTETFALEFEILSNGGEMQQDTYHVNHPKLGGFDLLLVPHTNGKGAKVLVATFSRFK